MANGRFPSALGGAARGFRQTFIPLKQLKDEREKTVEKRLRETFQSELKQSIAVANQFAQLAQQTAQAGGSEEAIVTARRGAETALKSFGITLDRERARRVSLGLDPSIIPSSQDFLDRHLPLVDASIEVGRAQRPDPTRAGKEAGEQKISEALTITQLDQPGATQPSREALEGVGALPDIPNRALTQLETAAIAVGVPIEKARSGNLTAQEAQQTLLRLRETSRKGDPINTTMELAAMAIGGREMLLSMRSGKIAPEDADKVLKKARENLGLLGLIFSGSTGVNPADAGSVENRIKQLESKSQ